MTIRTLFIQYMISMFCSMGVLIVFGGLGIVLLIISFLYFSVSYFYVKCSNCGGNYGIFAEKISFRSFVDNECSDCLKNRKKNNNKTRSVTDK